MNFRSLKEDQWKMRFNMLPICSKKDNLIEGCLSQAAIEKDRYYEAMLTGSMTNSTNNYFVKNRTKSYRNQRYINERDEKLFKDAKVISIEKCEDEDYLYDIKIEEKTKVIKDKKGKIIGIGKIKFTDEELRERTQEQIERSRKTFTVIHTIGFKDARLRTKCTFLFLYFFVFILFCFYTFFVLFYFYTLLFFTLFLYFFVFTLFLFLHFFVFTLFSLIF